jgi:hypothetical protein
MDIKKRVKNFLRGAYRMWTESPHTFDYENEKVLTGRLFPDQVKGALINAQDSKIEFFVRDNRILLKNLTDPEAIDELCHLSVDAKYPLAREIAVQCNYEPRGLHRRVLFFYATQQWEKYDALDPDGELLRRTYALATPDERKQIAIAGRAGGRSEIADAKPVPKADVELAIETLFEENRYAELWTFAREAAPLQSARAIHLLAETDWQPDNAAELIMYNNLSALAQKCPPDFTPVSTLREVKRFFNPPTSWIYSKLCLSPDAQLVVKAEQTSLSVFDLTSGEIISQKSRNEIENYGRYFFGPIISPNGKLLAYSQIIPIHDNVKVIIAQLPGLEKVNEFEITHGSFKWEFLATFVGDDKIAISMKLPFVNNGQRDYVREAYSQRLQIRQIGTGELVCQIDWDSTTQRIIKLAANSNGQLLEGCDSRGYIHFWNIPDATPLYTVGATPQSTYPLLEWNSLLGQFGYTNFYTFYGSFNLRKVGGENVGYDASKPRIPYCASVSPNLNFLAVGYNDHKVRLWDTSSGKVVGSLGNCGDRLADVKYTSDGVVSVAVNGTIKIWRSRLQEICERPISQSSLYDLFWLQKRLKRCKTKDEYAWMRFAEALLQPKFRYEIEIGDWHVPAADRYDIDLE